MNALIPVAALIILAATVLLAALCFACRARDELGEFRPPRHRFPVHPRCRR